MSEHGYVSPSSSKSDLNEYGFVSSKKQRGTDPVQVQFFLSKDKEIRTELRKVCNRFLIVALGTE